LPVIVTPNGPADVVRDGVDGYIVPSRDENAICDRLDRLYRDRDLRIEMGRNARARALEFTWVAYAANVERILDDLMSKTAQARAEEPGPRAVHRVLFRGPGPPANG
jgi:glycosyltransferase involved in cell wall biosynthesis